MLKLKAKCIYNTSNIDKEYALTVLSFSKEQSNNGLMKTATAADWFQNLKQ